MLDQHVVLDHRNLRVPIALTHHHETLDMFASGEEVLLNQLAGTAALTAIVAAALLLGLKSCGTGNVSDLVDVLLLARTLRNGCVDADGVG